MDTLLVGDDKHILTKHLLTSLAAAQPYYQSIANPTSKLKETKDSISSNPNPNLNPNPHKFRLAARSPIVVCLHHALHPNESDVY